MMLGLGLAGKDSGLFVVAFLEEGEVGIGAPGGGRGAPAEGPSCMLGAGIGGLLAPRGGRPEGATGGKLGTVGFGPRVGDVAPRAGAITGFVPVERVGTGEGVGPGGGGGVAGVGNAPETVEGRGPPGGAGGTAPDGGTEGETAEFGGVGVEPGVIAGMAGRGGEAGLAKGCLVTLNLGDPGGRGLTGSPSFGVSFREGRGGSGTDIFQEQVIVSNL